MTPSGLVAAQEYRQAVFDGVALAEEARARAEVAVVDEDVAGVGLVGLDEAHLLLRRVPQNGAAEAFLSLGHDLASKWGYYQSQ